MQREKAKIWVSNNKWRVITGLLISLLIIFILWSFIEYQDI